MITLPTSSIQPTVIYDGVWIRSININAPAPGQPITAVMRVSPYNAESQSLSPLTQYYSIKDLESTALSSSYVADTMTNIYSYVQDLVNSGSIVF